MNYAACTHPGRVRANNEDAYLIDAELGLFIVADGMGGHQAGDIASQIAVETVHQQITKGISKVSVDRGELLQTAILQAHKAVRRAAEAELSRRGMGTTLVVALLGSSRRRLWLANVGDSRAYLLRSGQLRQLTEDHTMRQHMIDARQTLLTTDLPSRHILSQAVGRGDMLAPSGRSIRIRQGDRLLLCTDGLSGAIEDEDIHQQLSKSDLLNALCHELIALANRRDGGDNITVVLVDVD